ncbi:MAG TPA: tRNA pseudouridine(38-40) synthase TruA [Streptosporangiaceae bacterium]|nr:tRNA pseudouridine(38-40) synthase TruA [Streptosporangiaceae bacterium]
MEQAPRSVRLRIDLAYDGSGFSGWAAQPGRRTVEETLAAALGRVLRLPGSPGLTVAGRTDAGVHARGQVVHVDVPESAWTTLADRGPGQGPGQGAAQGAAREHGKAGPLTRLAAVLPPDVRVHAVRPAPDGFDARFSALWRRYSYRVCDDPARADPLRRHETLWTPRRLDLAAMNEAAASLAGEHDFAAFCRRREGATTVRTLRVLHWHREAGGAGDGPGDGPDDRPDDGHGVAVATVVADAFCHNMVRALVGALLAVGEGRRPPGWPAEVLAAAVRDPAVRVVPPHGLCLEEVGYPEPAELAARAAETRNRRTATASRSASGC